MRGYSADQLKQIRVVTNAINRTNAIKDKFGIDNEQWHKQASILHDLGIDMDANGDFEKPSNKDILKLENVDTTDVQKLDKFYTASKLEQRIVKELSKEREERLISPTGEKLYTTNEIDERLALEYDMHNFITQNIGAIYAYETSQGETVIRNSFPDAPQRKKDRPTMQRLVEMRQEIESNPKKYNIINKAPKNYRSLHE